MISENSGDIVLTNGEYLSKYSSEIIKKGLSLAKQLGLVDSLYSLEKDAEEYYQIGLDNKQKENYQDAIENLTKALYLDPDHYSAYIERGEIYGKIGETQKAIEDYTQALKINPEDYFGFFYRGNLFLVVGDFQSAISDYNSALEVDRYQFADEEIYIKRGCAYTILDRELDRLKRIA